MKLYSKFQKRLATLAASAILATSLSSPLLASDYENHWAKDAIERWQDKGVVKGYEDGTFKPKQAITRAELAKIIVEIFGLSNTSHAVKYADVAENAWYAPYVAEVSSAGIMNDSGDKFNPNVAATREEAAYAIAMAYKVSGGNADFKDSDDISNWAAEKVGALAANGYVNGRNDGKFAPKDSLTRADVITMIDKITADLVNASGTYTKDIKGNLVVKSGDVVLKDMVVDGNLYIAEGVGEGDVTLDNVKVNGTIFLEGAGENSFKLVNGCKLGAIKVKKANGKPVRIYQDKACVVDKVDISSGCILEGAGKFNTVNVQEKSEVQIKSATIITLNIKVEASVKTDSSAVIDQLVCDAKVTVTGNGKITDCKVNTAGCKLEIVPKNTTLISSDVKVTIGSKEYNSSNISEAGKTPSNNNTSNNSSSNNNSTPSTPSTPSNPSTPNTPSDPTGPSNPENPSDPTGPSNPDITVEPSQPQPAPPTLTPDDGEVTVDTRNVANLEYQNKLTVPVGTTIEAVYSLLPKKITVSYNDGTTEALACTWEGLDNILEVGTYTVKGKVTLPEGCTDTESKLNTIKAQVIVEEDKELMAPASIVLAKSCLQPEDSSLDVTVIFPTLTTTSASLHVKIGDLSDTETQKEIAEGTKSMDITLTGLKEIPGGSYLVKAWVTTGAQMSAIVETPLRKLEASKVPASVSNMEELRKALVIATDELQSQVTFDISGVTLEEIKAFKFTEDSILSGRLNGLKSGCITTDGKPSKLTYTFKYKKMYEAIKAYNDNEAYGNKISEVAKQSLEKAKTVIQEVITDSMTDVQKEKAIHDYIVAHTAYSDTISNDVTNPMYSIEGVLLNQKAVCQGYAETMKLFMDMLNIECQIVTGYGIQADGKVAHAWNLVKLDNEWYHVDATWDDPTPDVPNRVKYGYFNVTTEMITKDHEMDGKGYPAAEGTKYFYYAANKVNSLEELNSKLNSLLKDKNYEAELYCDFDIAMDEFENALSTAIKNNNVTYSASISQQGKLCSYKFNVQ